MEVLILTGDRDSLQLVTERSTVLYPMRGVSDLARMTPAAVEDKYGVPPDRYPELAAIVGETSDNLPGVPGVGQGYAAKWLNPYDGLDNVIAHADEITGKKGEALREHLGDVIRNRRLNALVTDLDLGSSRPSWRCSRGTGRRRSTLFDELEFRGELRDRTIETLAGEEPIDEGGFELAGARSADGEVGDFLDGLGGQVVGLHVRGTWGAGTGRGRRPRGSRRPTARRPTSTSPPSAPTTRRRSPAGWPIRPGRRCCTTPRAPSSRWPRTGGRSPGVVSDTALTAYLARPDQRSYDLADLTLRYLRARAEAGEADERPGRPLRRRPADAALRPRCCTPGPCSTCRGARRASRASRRRAAARPTSSCRW